MPRIEWEELNWRNHFCGLLDGLLNRIISLYWCSNSEFALCKEFFCQGSCEEMVKRENAPVGITNKKNKTKQNKKTSQMDR